MQRDIITKGNLKTIYESDATLVFDESVGYPICVEFELIEKECV